MDEIKILNELVEDQEFDLFNLLSLAIRSEINAQNNYESLSNLKISSSLREKLMRLRDQEMEHEYILRDIFTGFYPQKEPKTAMSIPDPEWKLSEVKDVSTLLKKAMKEEKRAEEFYKKLARKLKGANKKLVSYLSYIEREHYETLKKEVEERES